MYVAYRNGMRLLKLVNSLLDFARIEAGRVQANYEPTDLAAFTADLASSFRSATEKAGLRFRVDCPPLPQPVYVDRDMWEKIVLNLISNAFKFTFEGEIGVRLEPSLDGSTGKLTIRTPARGFRWRKCRACSSDSTAWKERAGGRRKGRASAWRWCRSW